MRYTEALPSGIIRSSQRKLPEAPVRVGMVFASTHRADQAAGKRQHRTVTEVSGGRAYLYTNGSRQSGAWGVKLSPTGRLPGHRRVA